MSPLNKIKMSSNGELAKAEAGEQTHTGKIDFSKKKSEIRARMAKKMETPREKEIRERNEQSKRSGIILIAKDRHERRHNKKKGLGLAERNEWMKIVSKER